MAVSASSPKPPPKEEKGSLALPLFEIALRVRQGLGLDEQPLSFVAVTTSAEAQDNCVSRTFRFDPAGEQCIARRHEREIVETGAVQA